MRNLFFAALIFGCAGMQAEPDATGQYSCDTAASLSPVVAFERFDFLVTESERQAAALERLSGELRTGESTVEEVDEAGRRLGETLGETLVLCSCHEQLSITEECVVLLQEMDWAFD